jgi:hypothetical protein
MIVEAKLNQLDNYIVRIGDDLYEANEMAHMPNGLFMYVGTMQENDIVWRTAKHIREDSVVYEIPIGIAQAIANTVAKDFAH